METLVINAGIALHILVTYVTIVFLISQLISNNSIMDIAYGPAFFIIVGGTLVATVNFAPLPTLMAACIGMWSVRLSIRIFLKNKGKPEDIRYAKWREVWMERGPIYFVVRSYVQINLLQGAVIFLVALPGLIALSATEQISVPFALIGLMVFVFGIGYETLADWQLDRFLADKKAGKVSENIMTTGLFEYSRRPNYFGETLVWWGFAIMVLPLPFGWVALISPLLITYIVTKVTGPMLENIFLEKYPDEYRHYMETTPYLVPDIRNKLSFHK